MDYTAYVTKAIELSSQYINQYGPRAWDLLLWTIRIDGLQHLIAGSLCLFAIIAITVNFFIQKKRWMKMLTEKDNRHYDHWTDMGAAMAVTIPSGVLVIVLFIPTLTLLGDIWTWISVFYPELTLAKQAILTLKR
jgi:hypothetical protein